MGKGRNLAKLVIDKNKIDELSLHNALTAICDESNAKTDFLQIPLSAGAAKGVIGSVRLTPKGFEAFNGIDWISLAGSVEILHSVSGSIINNYQTNVTLVFDTDKTSSDVVFLHNGTEIARERITHAKGTGISHVLSLPSAVFYQAYDEDVYIFLETLQHYKSKNLILKKVKQIARGGSISQSNYTFTHKFLNKGKFSFNSNGTRYCNVHAVGGGATGGASISESNTFSDDNYISGGGGGGGHLSKWSGNVSGNFTVTVGDLEENTYFGNYVTAGTGGRGAHYNEYAQAGDGGGSGGGASNDYDRGWNRNDYHGERQVDARSGGGNGAGGQGGTTAGGGGGGNSGHNATGNTGGSGSWSSLLNQTVGRGGDGGTSGSGHGFTGSNYGDGGGGDSVDGRYVLGNGGAVAVQYTVS